MISNRVFASQEIQEDWDFAFEGWRNANWEYT